MLQRLRMRRCHQVAKVLQGYLDGEVDPRTARKVHDHLEACRRCGLEATTYTAIKNSIPMAMTHGEAATVDVDPAALSRLRAFTADLAVPPADAAPRNGDTR